MLCCFNKPHALNYIHVILFSIGAGILHFRDFVNEFAIGKDVVCEKKTG